MMLPGQSQGVGRRRRRPKRRVSTSVIDLAYTPSCASIAGVDSYFTEINIFHPFDCLRVRVDNRV